MSKSHLDLLHHISKLQLNTFLCSKSNSKKYYNIPNKINDHCRLFQQALLLV